MAHFDIPFVDRNSERKMLPQRVRQIIDHVSHRIFSDSECAGDFLMRDGQSDISKINEGEWKPFGKDDYWGYREQYCWFKQTVTVPERFSGKNVVYSVTPRPDSGWNTRGEQFIVYVDGKMVQGVDLNHDYIRLVENAKGGETFEIALSAYCDDHEYRGPVQLRTSLKTIDDEVSGLYYDLLVAWDAAHFHESDDLDRIDSMKLLNEAVSMLDMNTSDDEYFHQTVKQVREFVAEKIYGADSGVVSSAIGHTHIDTAWLWRIRQTRDKAGRSFATVVNLMKEFPEYKFMSPQAQLYDYVKQDYPELYNEIKEMVKQGRWEAEGSMWVESDTNVVSGESLVRQFLVGKRFFRDEFGADNKIMWLPDVFGYSAALPQIMKLADINYFMTTKISWNEYNRFPFDTFMWKGIDGTKILSHFSPSKSCEDDRYQTTYNTNLNPCNVIGGWKRYSNKDLNRNYLCSFGHGDGGGGPTRGMLENGRRMAKGVPGCPNVKMEFARDFFDRLAQEVKGSDRLPEWAGELYLEFHRGTLTAQARNKKYNRKSELLYHDAETLCEIANILKGEKYPSNEILEAWKIILLNQFHDIIPGSSIAAVYEDSKEQYEQIGKDGREIVAGALKVLADGINTEADSLVVFNTLGFARDDVVITDMPARADFAIVDEQGNACAWQKTYDGRLAFFAKNVPSKGFKAFRIIDGSAQNVPAVTAINSFENDFYKVDFDEDMNITSLYHKESGRCVAPEGELLNRLIAYEDRPHNHEAWDIKCYYGEKFWNVDKVDSKEIVESGAVRTVFKVERTFNLSKITQYFIFYPHTARIDVAYDVDWKEKRIALKADYPVDVNTVKATFDIQFGNIERNAHNNTTWDYAQFEVCGHKWADLSDNSFGFSVLNDCKYGWTVKDGHIKPTLLRSATAPNHLQDRERHTFTYALYPHSGAVSSSAVVEEGYSLNVPLYCVFTEAHKGELGSEFSLVSVDKSNVIIETVKKAEDSNALIVRLYETWNRRTPCRVDFGKDIAQAYECNLLEEKDVPVDVDNNGINLTFKPFEIKTLKLILK